MSAPVLRKSKENHLGHSGDCAEDMPVRLETEIGHSRKAHYLCRCASYSSKDMVAIYERLTKMFGKLPPAPQIIPPAPTPTRRKRYWTAEEDEFIYHQYAAGLTVTAIARQLASNRWAVKKRVERLGLLPRLNNEMRAEDSVKK